MYKYDYDPLVITESLKFTINKDKINYSKILKEKEVKLEDMTERYEKLENECLKFKIQIKNLEDKLSAKKEKEYSVNLFFIFD